MVNIPHPHGAFGDEVDLDVQYIRVEDPLCEDHKDKVVLSLEET